MQSYENTLRVLGLLINDRHPRILKVQVSYQKIIVIQRRRRSVAHSVKIIRVTIMIKADWSESGGLRIIEQDYGGELFVLCRFNWFMPYNKGRA